MVSHLLIPTDFSDAAAGIVDNLEVFRDLGAEKLMLLHVQRVDFPTAPAPTYDEEPGEKLEAAARKLRRRDWDVEIRTERGRPANKIVAIADQIGADAVAMANRGRTPVGDVLVGSVATEVLEHSPVPVFLHSTGGGAPVRRNTPLLVPVDFSPASVAAIEWVETLLADGNRGVFVLHVPENDEQQQEATDRLDQLRRRLVDAGAENVVVRTRNGRPKKVVQKAVEDHFEHLVVMGTHGRGWLDNLMFGGVARSVARLGKNHVLFVPAPDG